MINNETKEIRAGSERRELWSKIQERMTSVLGEDRFCLGSYYSFAFKTDIKHLMMSFARYKFISKLFRFEQPYKILELGCSEGVGSLFFTGGGRREYRRRLCLLSRG